MHEKHKTLVTHVCSLIEKGENAHAFLFTGPRGVGKRVLVELVLSELIAHSREQQAQSTDRPFSFNTPHPDVLVIERSSDSSAIVLEDIQRAHQRLLHHPVWLPWNTVVVCDAHEMNAQTANAFLKLLEEPPPSALIFLTATTVSALLPTIVSRCHRIPVCSVSQHSLTHYMEEKGVALDRASWIAALSQGRCAFAEDLVKEESWEEYTSFIRTVLLVIKTDLPSGFRAIEQYTKEKDDYQRMCEIMLSLVRDLIMLKISSSLPLVHEWLASELALMKDRFSLDRLTACMAALLKEQEYRSISLHRRLRLEDILLSFHHSPAL